MLRLKQSITIIVATVVASLAVSAAFSDAPNSLQPPLVPLPPQPDGVAWPSKHWPEGPPTIDVDSAALLSAADDLFAPIGRGRLPDTRALLVIQHGRIVFERYAEGFGPKSRFHTWSIAKSFTHALTGILVGQRIFELDAPAAIPQWRTADDPRSRVTLRQLLNMTSGIDNGDFGGDKAPGPGGFIADLLFGRGSTNATEFSADRELIHEPGTHWAYSTASSTLIAGMIGRAVGENVAAQRAFIDSELLAPIGASDIVFEFDRAGHFRGGSHLFGTARDFARLGLLYLRDGTWDGRRILPEGWVNFARTRAPVSNNGTYGAHFWINLEPQHNQFVLLPGGPTSVFEATGNAGQYVIMVPTHDVIIVRLGEMHSFNWSELNTRLAKLLEAFPAIPNAKGV